MTRNEYRLANEDGKAWLYMTMLICEGSSWIDSRRRVACNLMIVIMPRIAQLQWKA